MFEKCKTVIEKHCAEKGFSVLHWRDVPTDNSVPSPHPCSTVEMCVREGREDGREGWGGVDML